MGFTSERHDSLYHSQQVQYIMGHAIVKQGISWRAQNFFRVTIIVPCVQALTRRRFTTNTSWRWYTASLSTATRGPSSPSWGLPMRWGKSLTWCRTKNINSVHRHASVRQGQSQHELLNILIAVTGDLGPFYAISINSIANTQAAAYH